MDLLKALKFSGAFLFKGKNNMTENVVNFDDYLVKRLSKSEIKRIKILAKKEYDLLWLFRDQ